MPTAQPYQTMPDGWRYTQGWTQAGPVTITITNGTITTTGPTTTWIASTNTATTNTASTFVPATYAPDPANYWGTIDIAPEEEGQELNQRYWEDTQQLRVRNGEAIQRAREEQERVQHRVTQAMRRARELLIRHLDEEQRDQFEREEQFHVHVNGRSYLITRARSENVYRIENGVSVENYCIHPREGVPLEDQMLAQKLLLEADEGAFISGSNMHRLRPVRSMSA